MNVTNVLMAITKMVLIAQSVPILVPHVTVLERIVVCLVMMDSTLMEVHVQHVFFHV